LLMLNKYETLYVKDLAELLHLSSSSVSQLLSKMEKETYIKRELDPEQRRQTFVTIGTEGAKILHQMEETRNDIASAYLMQLTEVSIERPRLTIVVMILFILLGAVSLTKLPLQLFPEIDPPVAAVVSSYEGASPEEVEDKVTKPLEEELSTLPELDSMTSTSEEGMTLVLLEFDWSSSIDDVEQDIITSMNQTEIA